MKKAATVSQDVSGNWKIGDSVNIGTLKGLVVSGITQEGSLQKFTLKHPVTQKEYSFVPGGLRKTYEPPIAAVAATPADIIVASQAINKAQSILRNRCRRASDAALRSELQNVIALLSQKTVEGTASSMDTPQPTTAPEVGGTVAPAGVSVGESRF